MFMWYLFETIEHKYHDPLFTFILSAVLQSIWNLQIQCFHSSGGSLDSIGYLQVVKCWLVILLSFTGLSSFFSFIHCNLKLGFFVQDSNFLTSVMWVCLQALYNIPRFWCLLCRFLCCSGMYHWHCCLLLSSMYYCHLICCCRPGRFHILPFVFLLWYLYPLSIIFFSISLIA